MKRVLACIVVVLAFSAPAQAQPQSRPQESKAFAECQRRAAHTHELSGDRSVRVIAKAFCVNLRVTR